MAIIVGLAFIGLGFWGIFHWFHEILFVLKGLVPLVLLVSGVLALVVGIATVGSRRGNGKS